MVPREVYEAPPRSMIGFYADNPVPVVMPVMLGIEAVF
jgi:hypothetical protein